MRSLLLAVLVLFTSVAAFADNEVGNLGKIVCQEIVLNGPPKAEPVTAILTQTGRYSYQLNVFVQKKNGSFVPLLNLSTTAYGEDVEVLFTSARKEVFFKIYLDELDQSYLESKLFNLDMQFECKF